MSLSLSDLARRLPLGLAYFAAASVTISLTRYDGGVAFMWVAGSLLIADLMVRPRRHWLPSLLVCAVASGLATGLFGLGWAAALPFVAINLAEASLAAWVFRRQGHALRPLGSLGWLMHFVFAIGIVAPLVASAMAAAAMWALGMSPGAAFTQFLPAMPWAISPSRRWRSCWRAGRSSGGCETASGATMPNAPRCCWWSR